MRETTTKRNNYSRKPKNPPQKSQKDQIYSPYGNLIPFLSVQGRNITPIKPNARLIRNWSRSNPVVRRCIDIIKDRLTLYPIRVVSNDGMEHTKEIQRVSNVLSHPNNDDDALSFRSQVCEDLVVGDCGCFEIVKCGNVDRPFFLFPTDGFTVSMVLDDPNHSFAQKVTENVVDVPTNYVWFRKDEMMYLKKHCVTNTPYGLSPIEVAFKQIKTMMDTFEYSSEVASNAVPKYMANIKGLQQDTLNAYRVYFQNECMGTPNLPIVSAEDVSAVQISPVSEEATYKEYQQFVMCIVAQAFNIPAEKVGVTKSNDRSKSTEIDESLVAECIKPYANVYVSALNKTLAYMGFPFLSVEIVYDETKEQRETNLSIIKQQWQADIITYNEMRVLMGYPVVNEEYGNDLYSVYKAKLNAKYGGNTQFGNDKAKKIEGEDGENNE